MFAFSLLLMLCAGQSNGLAVAAKVEKKPSGIYIILTLAFLGFSILCAYLALPAFT